MDLRRRLITAVLFVASLFAVQPAHAALDNKGKEFIMAFLPAFGSPTIELHLTADVGTSVDIYYPVSNLIPITVAVGPGAVTIVSLPNTASMGWASGGPQDNAIRAVSNNEFVCYMINRETATSDAALALPVDVMNTEYIALTYYSNLNGGDRSEFVVAAAFDNTTVTITPKRALASGQPAGVPFSVVLDRGEGFLARGTVAGATGDLTGSIITADKPVGMTNGNTCTNVPPGVFACDHIFEVAQPTQTWGNRVIVRNLPNRIAGSVYRILASLDGTTVMQNGASIGTINRGDYLEVGPVPGDHVFESTNPIFVAQYMTGNSSPGATLGDPAMGNMMPTEQYLTAYTFSTVGGGQFAQNFVSIIAKNSDVGALMLDGVAIPPGDYAAIGATGYSSVAKLLTSGTHTTSSVDGHGITVEGYNGFDSYVYPGGAKFQFINPVGDANPPICEITIDDESATGTGTDNRPSEDLDDDDFLDPGEDLNGNNQIDVDAGIFFIELAPGSVNLTLTVDPFVPGAGQVGYSVTLTDPDVDGTGTVVVTDGAGNTCESAVFLESNQPPVAVCRDIEVAIGANCLAEVNPWDIDGGSNDPDGVGGENDILLEMSPEGPFAVGVHEVTLTVTDADGETDECEATVTVVDDAAPVITVTSDVTSLWPANHSYQTVTLSSIIELIGDCDDAVSVDDVVITHVTSDEAENANGNGDGNTVDDMVIAADCKSVDLRSERAGGGNGRVYRIWVEVTDSYGNTSTASYAVGVPHNNGGTAVEGSVAYTETGACGGLGKSVSTGAISSDMVLEANMPNPFATTTVINYTLASPGNARITLYTADGRKLGEIVNTEHAAGSFSTTVDGTFLVPGNYYYVLESNGSTEVQRMTVVR